MDNVHSLGTRQNVIHRFRTGSPFGARLQLAEHRHSVGARTETAYRESYHLFKIADVRRTHEDILDILWYASTVMGCAPYLSLGRYLSQVVRWQALK